jgi:hypothetical protein
MGRAQGLGLRERKKIQTRDAIRRAALQLTSIFRDVRLVMGV